MSKSKGQNTYGERHKLGAIQQEITVLSGEIKHLKLAMEEQQKLLKQLLRKTEAETQPQFVHNTQEMKLVSNEQNNDEEMKARYIAAKKEAIILKETLYEAYENEEKVLKAYTKLAKQYKSLSESKLGKLTLTYWRKRKGFRGK